MRRREFLALLAGASAFVWPWAPFAQSPSSARRVGILASSNPESIDPLLNAFTRGLAGLGDVEGKNLVIERRYANGELERLPALAAELAGRKVDVIFAPNTVAVEAARHATSAIPIVFATVDDPVQSGFVTSFAQPGGNITGISAIQKELAAKRVQILREAFPTISSIAVLTSAAEAVSSNQLAEIQVAARQFGIRVSAVEIRRRDDFPAALAQLRIGQADALYAVSSAENFFNRELLAAFAAEAKLPAMFTAEPYARAGGLISYSPLSEALFSDAAGFVHKILWGMSPAELPVQQPTRFRLVVNLRTAKALGLAIPQSFLILADEVIE